MTLSLPGPTQEWPLGPASKALPGWTPSPGGSASGTLALLLEVDLQGLCVVHTCVGEALPGLGTVNKAPKHPSVQTL